MKSFIFQNSGLSIINWKFSLVIVMSLICGGSSAQIDNTGCLADGFGVDAGLYSNVIEYGDGTPPSGSDDWFLGMLPGRGIISTSGSASIANLLATKNNPTFQARMDADIFSIVNSRIWVDAIYARDYFGGTGALDTTAYTTASKNAQDPAVWGTGIANVLGKNDLLDVAGFMRRNGTSLLGDLWFYGLITRAEPGGSAYVDFEFYVENLTYGTSGFSSGGPQMGHTAFTFDNTGRITKLGDVIFNVSMGNGGTQANVELRIWVSRTDYNTFLANRQNLPFTFGSSFDGALTGAPYGYATVIPNLYDACGYVNLAAQTPLTPPWGHKGTKSNTLQTNFLEYAVTEVGLNMSTYGIDSRYINGADLCDFPYQTFIVKSRSSEAFTAQLKDFAGPYAWAKPSAVAVASGQLSCLNTTTQVSVTPVRSDVTYSWSTLDGNIIGSTTTSTITVDRPGTYTLHYNLPTNCPADPVSVVVGYDATKPFFVNVAAQGSVACSGSNGTIDLSVTGATAPYTYAWSNSATTQDLSGLTPNTYSVTVTDAAGCTKTAQATVLAATPIVVTETVTNVLCNSQSTGNIQLNVSGKSPLYYAWSNGNVSKNISNLVSGTYTITVTDSDGCTTSRAISVTQPLALTVTVTKTNDTDPLVSSGNGTISLIPSGGSPAYQYSWSGPSSYASTSMNLTNLKYGLYMVTVTDANGCTLNTSAFIYEPEVCNDGIDNDNDGLTDCDDPDCALAAPTLSPLASVCQTVTTTYTATHASATSFIWSVPSSATILTASSGGYWPSVVQIVWNDTSGGQICVRAAANGCPGLPVCSSITVTSKPSQAQQILVD